MEVLLLWDFFILEGKKEGKNYEYIYEEKNGGFKKCIWKDMG